MKIIKNTIILALLTSLYCCVSHNTHILKQSTDEKKQAIGYNPLYDKIMFKLYDYYRDYYKYPENVDDFTSYLYDILFNKYTYNYGMDSISVKMNLDSLVLEKIPHPQINIVDYDLQILQYFIKYNNNIQIIYDDYIILKCDMDNNLLLSYKKVDICIDRYNTDNGSFLNIPSNEIKFYDFYGNLMRTDVEMSKKLYAEIDERVVTNYTQMKTISIDNQKQPMRIILKYNIKDGLILLCPDNIDLTSDNYLIDVKNVLYEYLINNPSINEIIMSVRCFDGKIKSNIK
jgi:hypothetical protein